MPSEMSVGRGFI